MRWAAEPEPGTSPTARPFFGVSFFVVLFFLAGVVTLCPRHLLFWGPGSAFSVSLLVLANLAECFVTPGLVAGAGGLHFGRAGEGRPLPTACLTPGSCPARGLPKKTPVEECDLRLLCLPRQGRCARARSPEPPVAGGACMCDLVSGRNNLLA